MIRTSADEPATHTVHHAYPNGGIAWVVRGFEHGVLDSSGDHHTPAHPAYDTVIPSGDGEHMQVGVTDDSVNGLFSACHSMQVQANATAH